MKGLELFALLLINLGTIALCTEDEVYSVRIVTNPSQGPFRIGQSVLFTCLIEPDPGNVTYRWSTVNNDGYYEQFYQTGSIYGSYNGHDRTSYRYCWYFCQVLLNQTIIGSSSRMIEVHGFVHTDELLVRSFNRGERLELNVDISHYISSLAWYHNGTEITSGNKYLINGATTKLSILNMIESDAGTYEAKINSVYNYYGDYDEIESSQECKLLPLLESQAIHAPVSFIVREGCSSVYDPSAVISDYNITDYNDTISRNIVLSVNSTHLFNISAVSIYRHWFKDGIRINDGESDNNISITYENGLLSNTLQITYNNTSDVTGHYVGVTVIPYGLECVNYTNYLRDVCSYYHYHICSEPSEIMYWNVNVYKPRSVDVPIATTGAVITGVFISGIVTGAIISTAIIIFIIWIKKLKSLRSTESPPQDDHKCIEMAMDANQAYETVEAGKMLKESDDPIYEQTPI